VPSSESCAPPPGRAPQQSLAHGLLQRGQDQLPRRQTPARVAQVQPLALMQLPFGWRQGSKDKRPRKRGREVRLVRGHALVCTTCMATSGNGSRIFGPGHTRHPLPTGPCRWGNWLPGHQNKFDESVIPRPAALFFLHVLRSQIGIEHQWVRACRLGLQLGVKRSDAQRLVVHICARADGDCSHAKSKACAHRQCLASLQLRF